MRHGKNVNRLIAIILVIALLPKAGMGLYCHQWLHISSKDQAANSSSNRIGVDCNCISDFSLPFIESAPVVLSSPETVVAEIPVIDTRFAPSLDKLYHSLRAPPVAIV